MTDFKSNGDKKVVTIETGAGSKETIETDRVLVAVDRTPNLAGLEQLDIDYDCRFVQVDRNMQASIYGIFAIGDLIGGYQIAHAASEEGIRVVHHISGNARAGSQPESIIPRCVYTFLEIASVGMTEAKAKDKGYRVETKKVDISTYGKAIAVGETSGIMK